MISKEEFAEIRRAVEGNLSCGAYDAIADWALSKLLADLDAANARIAELEAENRQTLGLVDNSLAQTADWQSMLYRADERASAEANAHAEEVATLKARIAELEAAAQRRPVEEKVRKLCEVERTYGSWSTRSRRYKNGSKNHLEVLKKLDDLFREACNLRDELCTPALPKGGM